MLSTNPTGPRLNSIVLLVLGLACASISIKTVLAAVSEDRAIVSWQKGPGTANLKKTATLAFPAGFRFADAYSTMRFLRATGEAETKREMGMLAPEEGEWSIIFLFDEIGYVKESGARGLNPTDLLNTINQNQAARRDPRKPGKALPKWTWEQKPAYQPGNHSLEWALRSETDTATNIQYNLRLLGRKGVMEVKLLCDIEKLNAILPTIKDILAGFTYRPGEKYQDVAFSDKLARGDVSTLITGEAVTMGSKLGFWATILLLLKKLLTFLLWVVIIAAVAAVVGAAYWFYRLYFGGGKPKGQPTG